MSSAARMSESAAGRGGQTTTLSREITGGTAYMTRGKGEPIVFIHGVGLNADAWLPQIEAFAAKHQVVALDMLGHGGSTLPAGDATLEFYVDQLRRLLDDLDIPTATVVGHSMGGLVALGFALKYPARTLRVAVLNSVYERDPKSRSAPWRRAHLRSQRAAAPAMSMIRCAAGSVMMIARTVSATKCGNGSLRSIPGPMPLPTGFSQRAMMPSAASWAGLPCPHSSRRVRSILIRRLPWRSPWRKLRRAARR